MSCTRTSLWFFFLMWSPSYIMCKGRYQLAWYLISALPTSSSASKTKKYLCFSNQFVLQTILTWTSHSFPAVLNKKEYYFVRLISFCHDSCMIERAHKFTLSSWLFHYVPTYVGLGLEIWDSLRSDSVPGRIIMPQQGSFSRYRTSSYLEVNVP